MDTKLKKSKLVISYTAWFLGIAITLFNLFYLIKESINYYPGFVNHIKEVFREEYQETGEFKQLLSDYMNNFLSMSVNGPAYYYNYYYNDNGELSSWSANEQFIYEEAYDEADSSEEIIIGEDGASTSETETAAAEIDTEDSFDLLIEPDPVGESISLEPSMPFKDIIKQGYIIEDDTIVKFYTAQDEEEYYRNLRDAAAYHDSIKNNTNMLYTIANNGKIIYTNHENLGLYTEDFVLPEGYNFVMYFDGEKIRAEKDGKSIDLYGDGIYEDTDIWFIPGYKNFPVDESIKDSEICIVLAQTPALEVARNYNESYSRLDNNIFYDIQKKLSYHKILYTKWIYAALTGLILIGLSIVMHRYKKEADRAIALFTGNIWYELKLLPFVIILFAVAKFFALLISKIYYYGSSSILYKIGEWLKNTNNTSLLTAALILCIISLWYLCLFVNDLYYNKEIWKNSLTYKAISIYRTSALKLPAGKRLIRRSLLLFLTELFLILAVYFFLFWEIREIHISEEKALVISVIIIPVIISAGQLLYGMKNKKTVRDMDLLLSRIEEIHDGKIMEPYEVEDGSDLQEAFIDLDDIQSGMNTALQEQVKSERMKVELIANVSHDIKTPLTSIISYVELLRQEEDLPEYVKEYINILEKKSQRLKKMVQDVFEVSKAASGELPVHMEDLDLGKLLRQTLADMSEQIEVSKVTLRDEVPDRAILIHADGERLYRVFQNLIQNALNYSLEGSRVYITLQIKENLAVASVKNVSREELPEDMNFTERFVRGDKSRSDGGSGLGLSIAQSFTEACGGTFKIETILDLFIVTISFPEVTVQEETE